MSSRKKETTEEEYAGFWIRLAAHLLDGFLLSMAPFMLFFFLMFVFMAFAFIAAIFVPAFTHFFAYEPNFLIPAVMEEDETEEISDAAAALLYVGFWFYNVLYYTITTGSRLQASVGKWAVGIYVKRDDGKRITYKRAFFRSLMYFFSYLTCFIGFMMAGWTKRKQGLHDKLAGTVVVYGKPVR